MGSGDLGLDYGASMQGASSEESGGSTREDGVSHGHGTPEAIREAPMALVRAHKQPGAISTICGSGPAGVSLRILGESPPSVIDEGELSWIQKLYSFPKGCEARVPHREHRVDWRVPGEIFMYEVAFKVGLRLPLPPFIKKVLSYYKIAPSQLMPNAWRVLLGLQVLSEIHQADVSIESFQYMYYFRIHDYEKGRIQVHLKPGKDALVIMPTNGVSSGWKGRYFLIREVDVFGSEGPRGVPLFWRSIGAADERLQFEQENLTEERVEKILRVPVKERSAGVLLAAASLAQTSIWSRSIAESGVPVDVFVRRFKIMEKSKTREFPNVMNLLEDPDLVERKKAKRRKRSALGASSSANGPAEGVPLLGAPPLKKGGDPKPRMPANIVLNAEPGIFSVEGHFELLDDVDKFREGGLSLEVGRVVHQAIKGLHAAVLLSEDVKSLEQKYLALESSVGGLEEEVQKLKDELSKQVKRATAAEDLLEKERAVSKGLEEEMVKAIRDSALNTRRQLMRQIVKGENKFWKPEEEIENCNLLLGDDPEEEEDGEGVPSVDSAEQALA